MILAAVFLALGLFIPFVFVGEYAKAEGVGAVGEMEAQSLLWRGKQPKQQKEQPSSQKLLQSRSPSSGWGPSVATVSVGRSSRKDAALAT